MAKFSKALRQQILDEFTTRHNGQYNPALFVNEVKRAGPDHPAFDWFEWDDDDAAHQHRLWQAREFARDLRVTFTVEELNADKTVKVRQVEAPMVLSPVDQRKKGGGYYKVDLSNPEHMAELCRQAATALSLWLRRYEAAVMHTGGSPATVRDQIEALEGAAEAASKAA